MSNSTTDNILSQKVPTKFRRVLSVWKRHIKVYVSNLGNGFPPLVEPLFFIIGLGLGLGKYIGNQIGGKPYIEFLVPSLAADVAMWTATFECTYGTFIRMNYDNIYHPMASTPVNIDEIILGEIIFAGSKGFIFSLVVIIEMTLFGYVYSPYALLVPIVGFLAGIIFGAIGMFFTSLVQSINSLNFFNSGLIAPMMFLSGVFFPVEELPETVQSISFFLPLTHVVKLMRSSVDGNLDFSLLTSLVWLLVAILIFSYLAIYKMKQRIII